MRSGFEGDLRLYSQKIKEEKDPVEGGLDTDLLEILKGVAKLQGTKEDTQQGILYFQRKKQEMMDWLKERLRQLDHPESQAEKSQSERELSYNEAGDNFW